ncbi:hypothetical protein GCM10029964_128400 [Kibdelosporangium lantanae]
MSAQPEWTLEAVPDRPRTTWNAAELMAVSFPEPTWAVPGIIAEGVTLLAGPPKVGKSWLSLGLGLSIAAGLPALGTVAVDPGPVLYLALEDTPRRLQSRMRTVLAGRPAPAGLTLDTYCPPLPTGETITSPAGWTKTPAPVWSSSTCSPRSEATPPPARTRRTKRTTPPWAGSSAWPTPTPFRSCSCTTSAKPPQTTS